MRRAPHRRPNRAYGRSLADAFSRGEKDPTFTTAPTGTKDTSRLGDIMGLVGRTFSSGGHEGGGYAVGWVLRNGVYVPAIESAYSPGAGMLYTYYTPTDTDWSRMVDAMRVRAKQLSDEMVMSRVAEPRIAPAAPQAPAPPDVPSGSGKTTVSTTAPTSAASGGGLTDKPWFWPAVVVVGAVGFMYLRDRKRLGR